MMSQSGQMMHCLEEKNLGTMATELVGVLEVTTPPIPTRFFRNSKRKSAQIFAVCALFVRFSLLLERDLGNRKSLESIGIQGFSYWSEWRESNPS